MDRQYTETHLNKIREMRKWLQEKIKRVIYEKIRDYVKTLEKNKVPIWRLYLYGSHAKNTFHPDSDIDLAVFWDRDDIDGMDEDVQLRMLSWDVDLRIEPHSLCPHRF